MPTKISYESFLRDSHLNQPNITSKDLATIAHLSRPEDFEECLIFHQATMARSERSSHSPQSLEITFRTAPTIRGFLNIAAHV